MSPAILVPSLRRQTPPVWSPPRAPRTVDGTSLLIGGRETTDTDLRTRSLRCEQVLDARGKLSCQLIDPPVTPAMDMDVLLTLLGVPFFGGIVVEITQTDTHAWSLTASDNRAILDSVFVNSVAPAGTLESVLHWMVTTALGAYGFSVGAMAPGPVLPALAFPFQSYDAAVTQLGVLSGWTAVISPTRVITMYPGGTVPAPWAINETTDTIQAFTTRQSREGHATHVWVRFGSGPPSDITWTTVGDGAAVIWTPPYYVATPPNVVTVAGTPLPVFPYPDPGWSWEATTGGGRLHAPPGDPPLAAGTPIVITFAAAWPSVAGANDPASPSPIQTDVVVDYPEIFDAATAQTAAEGEIARRAGFPRTFQLRTARVGLQPGQTADVLVPRLGLDTEALVTGVRLAHAATLAPDAAIWWSLAVDLIEGNASRANWLTFWQQAKGGATGGTGSSVTGTIPPGPPTGTAAVNYATWPLGGDHDTGVLGTAWQPIPNGCLVDVPAGFTGRLWTVHATVKRLLGTGTFQLALASGAGEIASSATTALAFDALNFTAPVSPGVTYHLRGRCSDAASIFGASGYLEAVQP